MCCGIFSLLSCCFSSSCWAGDGPSTDTGGKIYSLLMMFVSVIVSLCLKIWGQKVLLNLYVYKVSVCKSEMCAGDQAVFRFSFALAIFFFIMAIAVYSSGSHFHRHFWFPKWIFFIGLVVSSFFIPNSVFSVYAGVSRFFAGIFLVLQILVLVDFAYSWNSNWVSKEKTRYYVGIVVSALALLTSSLVFSVLFFNWFAGSDNCGMEKFFISFNIVLSVAYTLISVSSYCEHGALLPSSVVMGYCTFLIYSALKSNPSSCNSFYSPNNTDAASVFLGVCFSAISICYSSFSLSSRHRQLLGGDDQLLDEANKSDDNSEQAFSDTEEDVERKPNAFFNLMMAFASMYMCMLLTNWASGSLRGVHDVSVGTQDMWVNIVTSWIASALYIWSLVAPALFPDRDFGY